MAFKEAKTWKDRLEHLQSIKNKCNEIIKNLQVPDDDVRVQGMIHVRQFCNTTAAVTIKLLQSAEFKGNAHLICKILGLQDIQSLKSCLGDLNKNSKASFLTMVQFALENCIEQVLEELPGQP